MAFGEPREQPIAEIREREKMRRWRPYALFMTIGRKDKVKVPDIIKSIAAEANIPQGKIGKIDVFDSFTFCRGPCPNSLIRVIRSVDDVIS